MPIATSIITLIGTFKDPILKFFSDTKDEVSFFLDNGLSDYINSIYDKFVRTKTFLYRNETVPFYDVFFPVSLKIGPHVVKVTTYQELFGDSNYVSIIGNAGSGKTMLMKHFFLTSINDIYKIPLFIELRNLNDFDGSFAEYLTQVIFNNKLTPNKKILERLLETGEFIFLLDGYDELYSAKKNLVTSDLEKFIDRYSKNSFIISSRPNSGIESISRFNNYFVQPLTKFEISHFIDLVLKGNNDKELGVKIKSVISKPDNKDYNNFLSSPLLLSMFILTFNTYPELPKKKSKFYWNVFDTLATKHDSFTKKGGYQHERKTGLQNEEYDEILRWFSYLSLFEGRFNFDSQYLTSKLNEIKANFKYEFNTEHLIEDLTLAIAIILVDGIEYKFPHKSLQEYFCAMLIKDLPADKKEKLYKSKFHSHSRASNGSEENFWNLCMELDKPSFTEFFLIDKLKEFKSFFEGHTPEGRFKILCGLSDHSVQVCLGDDDDDDTDFLSSYTYLTSVRVYDSLLKYLSIPTLLQFTFHELSLQLPIEVNHYLKQNVDRLEEVKESGENNDDDEMQVLAYHASLIELWSHNLWNIINKSNFPILLEDILESVDSKIVELEKSLEEESKLAGNLLDL
jgi:hypothetical protein